MLLLSIISIILSITSTSLAKELDYLRIVPHDNHIAVHYRCEDPSAARSIVTVTVMDSSEAYTRLEEAGGEKGREAAQVLRAMAGRNRGARESDGRHAMLVGVKDRRNRGAWADSSSYHLNNNDLASTINQVFSQFVGEHEEAINKAKTSVTHSNGGLLR